MILGGLLYLLSRELGVGGDGGEIAMPTVIGKTEAEANAILREAGLRVTKKEVTDEANEAGKVIDQDPDPAVQVEKDTEVTITVSQGAPSATVPDVRGRKLDAATEALESAGFQVRNVRRTDAAAAVDTVIDQDPKPGPGKRGADITLVVSNGPEQVQVPDVRGRPEGEAANLLGQAGFRTRTSVEQSTTVAAGLVIRTEPDAGTRLDKNERSPWWCPTAPRPPPRPPVTNAPTTTTAPIITIFPPHDGHHPARDDHHDRPRRRRRTARRPAGVLGQEVRQQLAAGVGEDRLRVELHPFHRQFPVAEGHDHPVLGLGGDLEHGRHRVPVDDAASGSGWPRTAGAARPARRRPGGGPATSCRGRRRAPAPPRPPKTWPMHWWPRHTPRIGVTPANRSITCVAHAGVLGPAGAGRDEDGVGRQVGHRARW